MKRLRVGLNGFGRIGRAFTRILLERDSFDLVLINTRKTKSDMLAYLLKHDSVYRAYKKSVSFNEHELIVEDKKIALSNQIIPEAIDWNKHEVDLVVDATGAFTKETDLKKHLQGTVKKVILTAPTNDEAVPHIVLGVNDEQFDWTQPIISNASCTTNCAAPLLKVLSDNFQIESAMLTTVHAITMTQSMLDDANKGFDRSRSAIANIVPSTSGAAKAIEKTIPELAGKLEVGSIRVPVATGSLCDFSIYIKDNISVEQINGLFKHASEAELKGILGYETEVLVSSDYIGSAFSCIYAPIYTKINNRLLKILGWYDNEWGYSTRLVDLVDKVGRYVND